MKASGKRRLEWSRLGLQELYGSFETIAADNVRAAALVRDRILQAANLLVEHPHIGKKGQRPTTRELPVAGTPYTLVYRVYARAVKIGRVLHQRRKYP
jgi:plasmid stabilization system protein ParE